MDSQLSEITYYEILEVSSTASNEEIKSSYQKLILKWHPDKSLAENSASKFQQILEAYKILSDSSNRREYDRILSSRSALLLGAAQVRLTEFVNDGDGIYRLPCRCGEYYVVRASLNYYN